MLSGARMCIKSAVHLTPACQNLTQTETTFSARQNFKIIYSQEDYEFRRCSFEKTRIRTVDADGVPLTLKNYKFLPGTKCGIIRCKAQYAGPWTKTGFGYFLPR